MSEHNQFSRFSYQSALALSQTDSMSESTESTLIDLQALSPGFFIPSTVALSQIDSMSESTESTLIDLQASSPVHSDGAVTLQESLTQIATIASNMAGAALSNSEDTVDDSFLFHSKIPSFLLNSKAPAASFDSEDTDDDEFWFNSKRTFPKKQPAALQQEVEGSTKTFDGDISDGDIPLYRRWKFLAQIQTNLC